MLKDRLNMLEIFVKLNSKQTEKSFDLPEDYVISKFYELGYKVSHNRAGNTYQSCCPLCKEGKSWGRSQRCYYIPANENIFCHNCGESLKPYNWIRRVSGMTDAELRKDLEDNCSSVELKLEKEVYVPKKSESLPEDSINLLDPQQVSYYDNDHI